MKPLEVEEAEDCGDGGGEDVKMNTHRTQREEILRRFQ